MFKRILVPLDGSDLAGRALPVAARIARTTGGSIILFGVATTPVESGPYIAPSRVYAQETIQDDVSRVKAYLQEAANSPALAGLTVETHAVFDAIAPAIIAATQTYQADIVVLCSHGYSGAKRWMIGSVAQKVARHCPVPALVLRVDGAILSGDHPLRVLVSVDGSSLAESVIEPAMQFITDMSGVVQSELHLLRVISVPTTRGRFRSQAYVDFETDIRAQEKQEAQAYLAALVNRLQQSTQANVKITSSTVVEADIAAAIIHASEQSGVPYDVIAMATHGRGGIQRWTLGSITERILGTTRLPLLIVRPREVREAHRPAHVGAKEGDLQPWSGLL
ncbi:MAG TPA: universal stress protein [Ktedonobacteraceae bacterium]|nr:universal stress protein [Ktedonobacteraceae bacterium]